MKLFVTSLAESWSVLPGAFRAELAKRWPNAVVEVLTNSDAYSLEWRGGEPECDTGRLGKGGDSLTMEGSILGCARVAAWFRELVPPLHTVKFYDQGYNASVDVLRGMTGEEIAAAYVAAAKS